MKVNEIITEAHHSIIASDKIGKWTVHIDSHAFVSISHRGVSLGDVVNILTFFCKYIPEIDTIPRGKGAYIQDTNTLVSLYIRRSKSYPTDLTLETVLSPSMKPSPPLFRRSVPPPTEDMIDSPELKSMMAATRRETTARGRDAVSQDFEALKPKIDALRLSKQNNTFQPNAEPPLNREQRRAMAKMMRKQKQ